MLFAFSMPGGAEWLMIIVVLAFFLICPILAFIFYIRNKDLKKELERVTNEKNELLSKIIDKTS